MILTIPKCPKCGANADSVYEVLEAVASIDKGDDGSYHYSGHSEVVWDSQVPERQEHDTIMVSCEEGHNWLTPMTPKEG